MKRETEYLFNPLLFFGIGLFPMIFVCTTLKYALIFSALIILELIICNLIISAFKPLILKFVRIPCYVLVAIATIYLIDSLFMALLPLEYSANIFMIQLLFVSVLVLFVSEYTSKELEFKQSLMVNIRLALSYALLLVVVATIREFLGYGTVFGFSLGNFQGIKFFNGYIGIMLIVSVVSVVYNSIANFYLLNRKIYYSLVNRYTVYLENFYAELESTQKKEGK